MSASSRDSAQKPPQQHQKPQKPAPAKDRLAEALRANLQRRKASRKKPPS